MFAKAAIVALSMTLVTWASAQEVQDRYVLVPTENGALRLDTETGEVSRCTGGTGATACRVLPEERLAYEAEIERLEDRLAALEGRITVLETTGPRGLRRDDPSAGSDLSVDREIDEAMDRAEYVMRRFFGLVKELRKEFETDQL